MRNIDFSNPNFTVAEEVFSGKTVGKITVFCEETGNYTHYVLLDDGSISQNISAKNRIFGEWITLSVAKEDDVVDSVADEFAKNEYSHSVKFYALENCGIKLYDKVKVSLGNKIFTSYVSANSQSKNENRILYTLGELQTAYPYMNLI